MEFDQSTRRRFIKLLGCAGAIALLAACTKQAVMPAVEFKGATATNDLVTDSVSQQAKVLGAPMAAVERATQISRQSIFPKKDVLAVFDISQPSAKKRFYVLDFKSGQVTAHYAAHGRDNGPYISNTPPFKWIIHPNWYTTAAFRAKNNGVLGRSTGCITLDPAENNELITRLQDGALVYVTVGDAPIEQYL